MRSIHTYHDLSCSSDVINVPQEVIILQSHFVEKGLKKTEKFEQNVVLLLFLFTPGNVTNTEKISVT